MVAPVGVQAVAVVAAAVPMVVPVEVVGREEAATLHVGQL